MKVLTLKQPWATWIAEGKKTIETRKWKTTHRGELAIHAGKSFDMAALKRDGRPKSEFPLGQVLCVAELIACRPMILSDQDDAMCDLYEGAQAWTLRDIRCIEPIPRKGQLSIFEADLKVAW